MFPVLSGCGVVLDCLRTHESGPGGGGIEQPIKKREGVARPKRNINKNGIFYLQTPCQEVVKYLIFGNVPE